MSLSPSDALIAAGLRLSNIAFNLAQTLDREDWTGILSDSQKAWDTALTEFRSPAPQPVPPEPLASVGDWRIDTSAGGPILVYKDCSVIEDTEARYVLGLIAKDVAARSLPQALVAGGDR